MVFSTNSSLACATQSFTSSPIYSISGIGVQFLSFAYVASIASQTAGAGSTVSMTSTFTFKTQWY